MSARDAGSRRAPLIGLTTSEIRTRRTLRPIPHGGPTSHELALGLPYVRAVEAAGGIPVVVPPLAELEIESLLDSLAGICLPGGPDLDPATYGEESHPKLGPFDPDVDRFELRLVRCADSRGLPLLAICRGAQALNVARGGTLIQHLPDQTNMPHRQPTRGNQTAHPVRIERDSMLARALDAEEVDVNTFHHQGIERLGRNLRPVAFAPDGTIEALEAVDRKFCIGVQWHAETLIDRRPQCALFESFIAACAGSEVGEARQVA
jgi:putative glutamine amidotransferase